MSFNKQQSDIVRYQYRGAASGTPKWVAVTALIFTFIMVLSGGYKFLSGMEKNQVGIESKLDVLLGYIKDDKASKVMIAKIVNSHDTSIKITDVKIKAIKSDQEDIENDIRDIRNNSNRVIVKKAKKKRWRNR